MIVRFLANVLALALATLIVPGIEMTSNQLSTDAAALVGVALIFGVVNSLVKPLFNRFEHSPTGMIVLGAALWVVNAALLLVTSAVCGFAGIPWRVTDPIQALLGALLVAVVSFVVNALFGRRGTEHR